MHLLLGFDDRAFSDGPIGCLLLFQIRLQSSKVKKRQAAAQKNQSEQTTNIRVQPEFFAFESSEIGFCVFISRLFVAGTYSWKRNLGALAM